MNRVQGGVNPSASRVDWAAVSRVVFITQQIDPEHPNLGSTVAMVRALADRVDEVGVLAFGATDGVLPPNCNVRLFGGASPITRAARFAAAMTAETRRRPQLVIAHMSPVFAIAASPFCRVAHAPLVFWFTHWRDTTRLRLAERVSTRVATVNATSFPYTSPKVKAIGHAIDVAQLPCRPDSFGRVLRLRVLGRTSPSKDLESLIAGARIAQAHGVELELSIQGPSSTPEERAYRERLVALSGDGVHVVEPVPRTEIPAVLAKTDLLLNAAAAGALDKIVYEASASCVPVLASNPGFAELLPAELRFERGNVEQLAERVAAFAALTPDARAAMGHELRLRVEAHHSVGTWADRILALGR